MKNIIYYININKPIMLPPCLILELELLWCLNKTNFKSGMTFAKFCKMEVDMYHGDLEMLWRAIRNHLI